MPRKITELCTKNCMGFILLIYFHITAAVINELVHDVKQLFSTESTSPRECFLTISACKCSGCHTGCGGGLPVVFHNSSGDSSE